jgi:hypothetical protein
MTRHFPNTGIALAEDADIAEVFTAPHAIVRGPDGRSRWVALCPRCAVRHEEAVVSGDEDDARSACQSCGAIVEVRVSGTYRVAPTLPHSSG